MKRWQVVLPSALVGVALMASSLAPLYAQVEDAPMDDSGEQSAVSTPVASAKKVIHLFSKDFPPGPTQVSTPEKETRFWQALDREMRANGSMMLTENLEEADYRVEIACSGVVHCATLRVDIKNPQRDVLSSFVLRNVKPFPYIANPNIDKVAHNLTGKLDERFKAMEKGGYGFYNE